MSEFPEAITFTKAEIIDVASTLQSAFTAMRFLADQVDAFGDDEMAPHVVAARMVLLDIEASLATIENRMLPPEGWN